MASEDSEATADLRSAPVGAPLGPVIALSVLLSLGALFVLAPVLWRVLPLTDLPEPFPDHHQDAETLIFVLAYALVLPLGIVGSARVSDRIAAGPNAAAFSVVTGLLSAGLALVVVFTRVSAELPWGGGPATLAASAALWWVVAAATLRRAAAERPWELATSAARNEPWVWVVAAVLLGPVVLSFADLGSMSVPVLLIGAAGVAAVLLARERVRIPTVPGWWGRAIDVALVALLVVAVPNVVVFAAGDPAVALDTAIIQFHQNFYLGPANQVLAGDAMLVEVISQYGVGSIYFLAGAFLVIPIGNGTLGLIEGGLSALMFIGTFAMLRIAGVTRLLAGAAMAVAVIALVYGLQNPLGALLQHGAFRFGLPIGVVLGAVAESRWPRVAVPARGLQLLTFAVASVWALEAFAYTSLTLVVVAATGVVTLPAAARRRELARWVVQIAVAFLLAHLVLVLATLAAAGELPDWGWYINTLREFLLGQLGNWTYDFSSFSPGLAVGALYLASAAAVVLVMQRRPDLRRPQRTMLIALAGMTAYGIALFSYIVNRGADHIIPYVCLPAVALGALWLTFVERSALGVPVAGRRAALAISLSLSAVLVAAAWSSAETRYPQSALAHVVPGGPSLASAVERLWDPPPLRASAPVGEELLSRHLPGEERSIVLTSADLAVEILLRAERGSAVPLGDPWEDSFVPEGHLAPLGEFVDGLEAGDRALLDTPARRAFDAYRRDPSLDPLAAGGETSIVPTELASLQEWVLREIGLRFDLRTVARTDDGLEVVELVPVP